MEKVKLFTNFCCYLATIILFAYCLNTYFKNEDVSEIIYKEYNYDTQSQYPSFSVCFNIIPRLLKSKQKFEIDEDSYEDFLIGQYWDAEMLNITYDEVTESLHKHLLIAKTTEDFSKVEETSKVIEGVKESTLPSYFAVYKCLTFDMPKILKQKVKFASIVLSNSIFPIGLAPTGDQVLSNFHLPNKMLGNALGTKWTWRKRNYLSSKFFQHRLTVKSMTQLRRRNKMSDVCKEYDNFDDYYRNAIMSKVGCSPPYWSLNNEFKNCSAAKDLYMIAKYTFEGYSGSSGTDSIIPKQCIELKRISYEYDDGEFEFNVLESNTPELKPIDEMDKNVTQFLVIFEDSGIKEIKQLRSFGIASLVGNVGGYIGLFLGFSIIQLPSFCAFLYQNIKGLFNKTNVSDTDKTKENRTDLFVDTKENRQHTAIIKRLNLLEERVNMIMN